MLLRNPPLFFIKGRSSHCEIYSPSSGPSIKVARLGSKVNETSILKSKRVGGRESLQPFCTIRWFIRGQAVRCPKTMFDRNYFFSDSSRRWMTHTPYQTRQPVRSGLILRTSGIATAVTPERQSRIPLWESHHRYAGAYLGKAGMRPRDGTQEFRTRLPWSWRKRRTIEPRPPAIFDSRNKGRFRFSGCK